MAASAVCLNRVLMGNSFVFSVLPPRRSVVDSAFTFRLVVAEGVHLAFGMQETLKGRLSNQAPRVNQRNRLTELAIPVPEGELPALEAGKVKFVAEQEVSDGRRIPFADGCHCGADGSYCSPGRVVFAVHISA